MNDVLQNTWPILLKTVKITKNKESLKNSQSMGAKGDVTIKCNAVPWIRSWDRRILGKKKKLRKLEQTLKLG